MRDGPGDTLLALAAMFVPLSLLSFGGSNAVLADIAQQSIAQGWTSERDFADFFALARAAPGPGSMLAALIGWNAAGLAGALVATLSLYVPAAILVWIAARIWGRWRGSRWHAAIERGLAPIAAGLFLSGGIAVLRLSPGGAAVWVAALGAAAILLRWPGLHPVPLMFAGGILFGVAGTLAH
jgi:chromate transporter